MGKVIGGRDDKMGSWPDAPGIAVHETFDDDPDLHISQADRTGSAHDKSGNRARITMHGGD